MKRQRLPAPYGRLLQRDKKLSFSFAGQTQQAYAGDTVASALYANGCRTLARSFKYHRPRGVLSMSGFDANALVQLGPTPNLRADSLMLQEGLPAVSAQNCLGTCLLYTSPSPRDRQKSRMPSSA